MRSIRVMPLVIGLLLMVGLVRGQDAASGANELRDAQVRVAKATTAALKEFRDKEEANRTAIQSIKASAGKNDEATRKKLDDLENEQMALSLRLTELGQTQKDLITRIEKGESGLNDAIVELKKKVDSAGKDVAKASDAVAELKAFTQFTGMYWGDNHVMNIQLETNDGDRHVPISHGVVRVGKQFKDGDIAPMDKVVANANGVLKITLPSLDSLDTGADWWVVLDFDGSDTLRACRFRDRIR